MKLEDSRYIKYPHIKLVLSFGVFYFFDKYIIAEINEGVHYNWEKTKQIIDYTYMFYGNDFKLAYISNRVHSYSIDLQIWSKMRKEEHHFLIASAVIIYDSIGLKIASLEKLFTKLSLKRCFSLDLAISWVEDLNEFKYQDKLVS